MTIASNLGRDRLDLGSLSTGYDCGPIEVLGPCSRLLGLITLGVCDNQDPIGRYFYNCSSPEGDEAVPAITTFLSSSIPW